MMLMPFAFIAVLILAVREIIISGKKMTPNEPVKPTREKTTGKIKNMAFENRKKSRAA
jgi:hypothetical protein